VRRIDEMLVMPSNDASMYAGYIAGKYPGRIGWLQSPSHFKKIPWFLPYALDNGKFTRWDEEGFEAMLRKSIFFHRPLWILVPDEVADAEKTMRLWHEWRDRVGQFGPLAFAAQDGMEPQDIPKEAHCCFIGGSTDWKLNNAHKFKGVCELLHVGRVNTADRLQWAEAIGADSVDGTGFFRGDQRQFQAFIKYFEGNKDAAL
jgi:hypothetical protein